MRRGGDDRLADGGQGMNRALPVLTVLLGIIVIWYAAAVWMNSTWVYDQARRAGTILPVPEGALREVRERERRHRPAPHLIVRRRVQQRHVGHVRARGRRHQRHQTSPRARA